MSKVSDTREKLLTTAIELVWQSNYANVGVNEICERSGVTKGGFYHYFASKAELFRAASEHAWQGMKLELDAIHSPENNALMKLEGYIDLIIRKQEMHDQDESPVSGCPFFTSGAQCDNDEPVVREVAIAMSERAQIYYTALIVALRDEDCLEPDIEPEQTARLFAHFVHGLLMYGRVMRSLDVVTRDLRIGVYRLVGLKRPLWSEAATSPV